MIEGLDIGSRRRAGDGLVIVYSIKCTFWMPELSKDPPLIVKCDRQGVGVVVCGLWAVRNQGRQCGVGLRG